MWRVERVADAAQRWRYGVVAVEVLLAAGCLYFGSKVVAPNAAVAPVRIHHAPSGRAGAFGGDVFGAYAAGPLGIPTARPGSLHPGPTQKRTLRTPNFTADWLSRLNADDYDLYRGQWQTLQLLMSGVRQYLEQRVVPRLLGH
jgi:hypothetical protein